MADRTFTRRVRAYRGKQADAGLVRHEVRISRDDRLAVNGYAKALRDRRTALSGNKHLALALKTVNAPRPHPLTGEDLLRNLGCDRPDPRFAPHMAAFFTELSAETLHWLVLTGVCSFEQLNRAQVIWRQLRGPHHEWIREMAEFSVARNACRHSADSASP